MCSCMAGSIEASIIDQGKLQLIAEYLELSHRGEACQQCADYHYKKTSISKNINNVCCSNKTPLWWSSPSVSCHHCSNCSGSSYSSPVPTSNISPLSSYSYFWYITITIILHSSPATSPFSSCSYSCYVTILLLLLLLLNHYCPPEASLSPWPARKDILRWCSLIGEQLSVPVTETTTSFNSDFIFREKNSTYWCFDGDICLYRICPYMLFWETIEHIREETKKECKINPINLSINASKNWQSLISFAQTEQYVYWGNCDSEKRYNTTHAWPLSKHFL